MSGSPIRRPAAILFDFDGVLAKSQHQHHAAWQRAYADLTGGKALPIEAIRAQSGNAPRHIAARFARDGAVDAEALYERKLELMIQGASAVEMMPGALALLAWCAQQRLPHGVASNSPTSLVRAVLASRQIDLDVILGEELYGAPKPDPEPYLTLAARLGVERDCLIIEDTVPGVTAGVASALGDVVGVSNERERRAHLRAAGARYLVDTPEELLARLQKRRPD